MAEINTFYPENDDEKISKVYETFNNNGFTSFEYSKSNILEFKGNLDFNPKDYKDVAMVEMISYYAYFLIKCSIDFDLDKIPNKTVAKQIIQADKEGILCTYLSVVANLLIRDLTMFRCKLIQGYSTFSSQLGLDQIGLGSLLPPMDMSNLHVFSTYNNGKVLDCSFIIENPDYNTELSHINGVVPIDVELKGWEESLETEIKYINMFASWDNQSMLEWKLMHIEGLKFLMHDYVQKYK